MDVMVQCRFPAGCTTRTKDASGLCSVHRRFKTGAGLAGRRVDMVGVRTMPVMSGLGDEVLDHREMAVLRELGGEYVKHVVGNGHKVWMPEYNNYGYSYNGAGGLVYWNGKMVTAPYSDEHVGIVQDENGRVIIMGKGGQNSQTTDNYVAACFRAEQDKWCREAELNENGEQYGSVGEAMAQLELGKRDGYKVTFMRDGMFRIKTGLGQDVAYGAMSRSSGERPDGTFGIVWTVPEVHGDKEAAAGIVQDIEYVRTRMEQMDYSHDGAYYLPVGWVDNL